MEDKHIDKSFYNIPHSGASKPLRYSERRRNGPGIPSSSNLKLLESNAAAAQIQLNVDQIERILHAVE